jgi:hypothetical protein
MLSVVWKNFVGRKETDNENGKSYCTYIGADDIVESGEEGDGCVVLNYALIFKKRNKFSNNRKQVCLQSNPGNFLL